ncbi:hypothetical protein C7U60_18640 [Mesorhizobium plurifarium]|nr:hypothetical protein C7U60_18770 [Mesorhizobium plurifarium]PST18838.1 hypothetical protein C7U60_18640 [Mesorhizobium plurifarium]
MFANGSDAVCGPFHRLGRYRLTIEMISFRDERMRRATIGAPHKAGQICLCEHLGSGNTKIERKRQR